METVFFCFCKSNGWMFGHWCFVTNVWWYCKTLYKSNGFVKLSSKQKHIFRGVSWCNWKNIGVVFVWISVASFHMYHICLQTLSIEKVFGQLVFVFQSRSSVVWEVIPLSNGIIGDPKIKIRKKGILWILPLWHLTLASCQHIWTLKGGVLWSWNVLFLFHVEPCFFVYCIPPTFKLWKNYSDLNLSSDLQVLCMSHLNFHSYSYESLGSNTLMPALCQEHIRLTDCLCWKRCELWRRKNMFQ